MESLLQDFRFAWRMLRKSPGFTIVAMLTLAVGIGANVAIFGFVDELWLRPMPVRDAGQLVRIFTSNPSSEGEVERGWSSYPDFQDLRSAKTLSGVALLERRGGFYDDGTQNNLVTAAVLSDNFFEVLQPTLALGRVFTEDELKTSHSLPVLLSYPFWQRAFHGDTSLVGHTIVVDRQPVTVLGILPRGFRGTEPMQVPDLWIPMSTWVQLVPGDRVRMTSRVFRDFELFGMLRKDVGLQQAKAELATISAALAQTHPETNAGRKITAVPETQTRGDWTASVGLALLAVAALVLLIACANVASLLLARAEHRRKEIATRIALGALPRQIIRQLLAETVLLGAGATVAAILLGNYVLEILPALLPQTAVPAGVDAYLSLRGLLFSVLVAVASLCVFGLVPALQASHVAPAAVLNRSGTQAVVSRRRLRSLLVIGQIALSVVAIVSAGLLVRSVWRALQIDPGFNAHQNMLIMEMVPGMGSKGEQGSQAFVQEARRRLESLPGVTATSIAMRFPFGMSGSGANRKVFVPDSLASSDRDGTTINFDSIGDGFFRVLGTRILRGRAIETQDLRTSARVVVVNERMANHFWPNGDAVGKLIRLDKPDTPPFQVIGVAENSTYNDFQEAPMPYLYIPMGNNDYGELALAVQTTSDPRMLASTVGRTLRDLDRDVPSLGMLTMREQVREALYGERLTASLMVALGGLGLLLAAVGLYGLMSFLVARRTQEIGVRLALGAQRREILGLVMRNALRLAAIGAVAGVLGSLAATRILSSLLFKVSPNDTAVMLGAIFILMAAAFAASLAPALHATKVDPVVALRCE
jgi:predicted permease